MTGTMERNPSLPLTRMRGRVGRGLQRCHPLPTRRRRPTSPLHGQVMLALSIVLFTLLAGGFASPARAAWPDRAITLIVPFAPGGPTDIIARILATSLHMSLGQPVIIDNRAGAAGNTGMGVAAHATPDGYTLLLTSTSIAVIRRCLRTCPTTRFATSSRSRNLSTPPTS